MVDPKLRQRGQEDKHPDQEFFVRLRLLAGKNQNRQPGDKRGKDENFHPRTRLQRVKQFALGAAAAGFGRSEAFSYEAIFFKETKHGFWNECAQRVPARQVNSINSSLRAIRRPLPRHRCRDGVCRRERWIGRVRGE